MRNKKISTILLNILLSLLPAAELCLLLDLVTTYLERTLSLKILLPVFLLTAAALYLLFRKEKCSRWLKVLIELILPAEAGLFLAFSVYAYQHVSNESVSDVPDTGKSGIFAGRRVMLIVPHEDDDTNLTGGILSEFVDYGSEVFVVFASNGDFSVSAETRINEAIAANEAIGIPENHLIFLGYGDRYRTGHVYTSAEGEISTSVHGATSTYGTADHPAYHEGNAYTSHNYVGDMEAVILDYHPDLILACDLDSHPDHKAVSLAFDKAMGRILQDEPGYRPVVLKSFAYDLAWNAPADYYDTANVGMTVNPDGTDRMKGNGSYLWQERIRIPVRSDNLSRLLSRSALYQQLSLFTSQKAETHAESVINSDKVFWQRRTDSLSYTADFSASSGDPSQLKDFMRMDFADLNDPTDNINGWFPDRQDPDAAVTITLAEPAVIKSVWLYDEPDPERNILNAELVFPDGTVIETGPLDPDGAATKIPVTAAETTGFELRILESEGDDCGLSEVEIYDRDETAPFTYIKVTDTEGNFVYDYSIDGSSTTLSLLTVGNVPDFCADAYTVTLDSGKADVSIEGRNIKVDLGSSRSCTLTVCDSSGSHSDTVRISRSDSLLAYGRKIDTFLINREDFYKNTSLFHILWLLGIE